MAFSSENHVVFPNSLRFEDFLKEEAERREEFISSAQREFHVDMDRYLGCSHVLTKEQLQERRAEVNIFLL